VLDESIKAPEAGDQRDSIRWRVIFVAALVALVAASAAILDGSVTPGAASPAATAGHQRTGAWFCPHGGGAGWKGWVALANPGGSTVRIRLTGFGASGGGVPSTFDVPAHAQIVRGVAASDQGAGTEVEYFGGWVQASATVSAGLGASAQSTTERCLPGAGSDWYVPGMSTRVGETAYLVALNPFAEVAEFDVALFTEKRSVRPGTLTPFVVPPRHSVVIKLNQFALLAQGENALVVHVASRVGRVVVGGVVETGRALVAEAGVPGGATRWVLPAGGTSAAVRLVAFNPGSRRSDLSVISQGVVGQLLASGTNGLSVPAGGVQTFPLRVLPDAGMVVQSTNGQPVVVALQVEGSNGDPAIVGGAPAAGSGPLSGRWLVVPGVPSGTGRATLVLENPGRIDAQVRIAWIGPNGPVLAYPEEPVTVPAGRAVQFPLPGVGGPLVSALVTVVSGEAVPAAWSSSGQGAGFAVVIGLPAPAGT
jgi:hypothetical protein